MGALIANSDRVAALGGIELVLGLAVALVLVGALVGIGYLRHTRQRAEED